MRHDRVLSDHFRREPYPSRRDPQGGSVRRGRGRTWTLSHAACQHVRACQLIKGSDGSSLAALRRRRVGRMWRHDVRLPSDSKSPRPASRRGLNSCDVEFMPVICPTCQIFCVTLANAFLFKSLDRRCRLVAGNRFGSFGNWRRGYAGDGFGSFDSGRRTDLGGRLFPGSNAGLSCMPGPLLRCGSPHSPGTRDRGPCCISDERACHRAHGSQDDRSRHRPQGSISSTILGTCFARHKCPCDQGANKQFLHRGSPRMRREGHGTPQLRRHEGMRPTDRRKQHRIASALCVDSTADKSAQPA